MLDGLYEEIYSHPARKLPIAYYLLTKTIGE
jgi:hypothetical protein